jgi:hypothetical protein
MSIKILLNESAASRRCVPIQLIRSSDGTSAATNESGRTFFFSIGAINYGSGGSLSVVSADMGLYSCNFSASKVSVLGQGMVYYGLPNSSGTALPMSVPIEIVAYDPFDAVRLGLTALPNAVAEAAGGLITSGTGTGQLSVSAGSVGLKAQTHSASTIGGIGNYANISNVTLHAGTHSSVTIQGVTRVNSAVTLNADTHSGATIAGIVAGGLLNASIADGFISSGKFASGAITAASLAADAGEEIADALLTRNIAGASNTAR